MPAQPIPRLTPEQYLEEERRAPYKSEYYFGQVIPRDVANRAHCLISVNLMTSLNTQLRDQPWETFTSDMRVQTSPDGLYSYPDLSVVCGEPQFRDERQDTLLNPVVIEVLSPSTEAYDRGRKFAEYWRIESLKDYILIAQDRMRIEHFVRQPDNRWLLSQATQLDEVVPIESIGCELRLSEVYDKVPLEGEADQAGER